jgi:hypothetical protein
MTLASVTILGRFCGPPDSGNGGYVCGVIAEAVGAPVQVRLLRPPPLDTPLAIRPDAAQAGWLVGPPGATVAEVQPFHLELEVPEPPGYVEALNASRAYAGFHQHAYPGCFVCGPERAKGDGLRIFAGAVKGRALHAAPWMPDASVCSREGKVLPEMMWAALDCPGYFAAGLAGRLGLLGQFAARIDRRVHVDEPCVIIAWQVGSAGRKHYAGTAIFDEDGELCGRALATWIEPR